MVFRAKTIEDHKEGDTIARDWRTVTRDRRKSKKGAAWNTACKRLGKVPGKSQRIGQTHRGTWGIFIGILVSLGFYSILIKVIHDYHNLRNLGPS